MDIIAKIWLNKGSLVKNSNKIEIASMIAEGMINFQKFFSKNDSFSSISSSSILHTGLEHSTCRSNSPNFQY
jgi:hypothetical protein